jgi:hypothetical protein
MFSPVLAEVEDVEVKEEETAPTAAAEVAVMESQYPSHPIIILLKDRWGISTARSAAAAAQYTIRSCTTPDAA